MGRERASAAWAAAAVLGASLLATGHAAATERYVFLGDSLSDNQNSFQFTARIFGAANAIPSVPPYADGRFSNGPNWTDRLAGDQLFYYQYYLGSAECLTENGTVASSGACDPALDPGAQPGTSMNFAFGGSRSGTEALLDAPGFLTVLGDLEAYNASGAVADVAGSVFTVWTGGNDYSAYAVANGGLTEAEAVDQVLDNIEDGLIRIGSFDPKRIVVLNIQPLETVPTFVSNLGPQGAATTGRLADRHNAQINGRLRTVAAQTGTDIVLVDVHSLYQHINANPALYGFTNITSGCIDESTLQRNADCATAADESGFLYWDGTHPTTAAHDYIAELYGATLQAVDQAPGRLAAIPDSSLVLTGVVARGVGSQLDQWRADTGRADTGRVALAAAGRHAAEAETGSAVSLFVTAANAAGTRAADGDFAGFDYDTQGGLIGFGYRPRDWHRPAVVGGHLGLLRLDAETPGGADSGVSFDTRAVALGAFAGVRQGPASVTAQVSGLYLDIDGTQRKTGFGVLPTARSDTQGLAIAGEIEGRWDFAAAIGDRTVWLAPLARLTGAAATIDGFTERNAEFLNLTVEDSSVAEVAAGLGLSIWSDLPLGTGSVATPFASAIWEHGLIRTGGTIRGTLPSGQAVSGDGNQGVQDRLGLTGGIRFGFGPGFTLDAMVSASVADADGGNHILSQLRLKKAF